jgi:pilus assembly protein CpaD
MRSKIILIALCSSVAACNTPELADKGLAAVNAPVVTSADYVFDAAAPDGALAPGESDRINGWFQGLGLGYGDTIFVDGPYADAARGQVAAIAAD